MQYGTSTDQFSQAFQAMFAQNMSIVISIWALVFKMLLLWVACMLIGGLVFLLVYLFIIKKSQHRLGDANTSNMNPTQQVPPVPQVPPTNSPMYNSAPLKTSGFAITSLVLGIVSLLPNPALGIPTGILALVFGILARSKIKHGLAAGGGMSTAGIILGIIGLIVSMLIILFFATMFAALIHAFPANINTVPQNGFHSSAQIDVQNLPPTNQ